MRLITLLGLLLAFTAFADEKPSGYQLLQWTDLIPKDDLDALLNPPQELNDIIDGSVEDNLESQFQIAANSNDNRYNEALTSTKVIKEFDKKKIRLPGYIVPLEFDEKQTITTFFLVPYFGACIHVPPPPPNQIIFAEIEKGFKIEHLYDPFWIEGTLHTELLQNELATAAYTISVDAIHPYEQ